MLVGAGSIGYAVAYYQGFKHRGFQIEWIFDNDPSKIGQDMNGMMVRDMSELGELVSTEGAKVAILAVPASAAQETTDILVSAGIEAILSYAPINLTVPPNVHVRYTDPVVLLQRMTYYL